jgi:hypothetical protein
MAIKFADFVPRQTEAGGFFQSAEYENFGAAAAAASAWIDKHGVRVVSMETVVLPNLWDSGEQGSRDPSIRTSGKFQATWHQFLRVWYQG